MMLKYLNLTMIFYLKKMISKSADIRNFDWVLKEVTVYETNGQFLKKASLKKLK